MFDYDKSEKFEKRVSAWSRDVYITPDFDKFHSELSKLIEKTGLSDIYTTKRASSYIHGRFVTFDSIFHYNLDNSFSPKTEEDMKLFVFEAIESNVQKALIEKNEDPSEYIMIIKFIDIGIELDDSIKDVIIRSAFYNFIKDEQVVL